MNRVGLIGGTFDPIHNGHLQLGQIVLDRFGLDRVMYIPAATPPHKSQADVSNRRHRLGMLKIALADRENMDISDIEMTRHGLSYTFDTLTLLTREGKPSTRYHFVIGTDAIGEIETWYRWQELLVATNFIVAVRPGSSVKKIQELIGRNGFEPDSANGERWVHHRQLNEIVFLADRTVDISSTDIRSRIRSGRTWKHMVPESVGDYICSNNLYGALN